MALQRFADAKILQTFSTVVVSEGRAPGVMAHVVVAECSLYDRVIVVCKEHESGPQIIYSLTITDELLLDFKETNFSVEIHIEQKLEHPIYLHFTEKAGFWRFTEVARHAKMFRLDRAAQLKALHEEVVAMFTAVAQVETAPGDVSASEVNVAMGEEYEA